MYTSFFGLNEKPFSITPDPRYLFMSERHGEALAHLVYGVTESGGFMQLTGEVGTGKTTLVRTLLQNRMPDNADVAVVLNPQLSAIEFLQTIGEELGVPEPRDKNSIKAMIDALNAYLLLAHSEGRRTILVVDEAQNLSRDVLEQVRLLTNLETSKQKLLQIVLIGQPELRELLARNDLRQLAQRITGRYHLEPLSRDETAAYIEHRLRVAGAVSEIFDAGAKRAVFRLSQGVPRVINVISDRALLGAYGRESRRVTRKLVHRAATEISGKQEVSAWVRWGAPVMVLAGIAVLGMGAWAWYSQQSAATANTVTPVETRATGSSIPTDESPEVLLTELAVADLPQPRPGNEADANETLSLDEELQLAADLTGEQAAFSSLFELWGLSPPVTTRPCDEVLDAGYECLAQRGSWSSLKQYDRPVVLSLTDSRGDTHFAVLTAINGEQAALSLGGVDVSHPIDDVSSMWFGDYRLMWKPPNGSSAALGPGSRDPNVAWLRTSLAAIDARYRAEPIDSEVYDATLAGRVRDFQRDNRLLVDGLAGRQTQIIINTLLNPDNAPRLTTPRLAKD